MFIFGARKETKLPPTKDDETEDEEQRDLWLPELERLLTEVPSALADNFRRSSQAINLHYLEPVLLAQIDKALRGDTAAAKFLVEFAERTLDETSSVFEGAPWEDLAIRIRDKLGLEIGAEEMVMKMLKDFEEEGIVDYASFGLDNRDLSPSPDEGA